MKKTILTLLAILILRFFCLNCGGLFRIVPYKPMTVICPYCCTGDMLIRVDNG